jgi:hypothetical protein
MVFLDVLVREPQTHLNPALEKRLTRNLFPELHQITLQSVSLVKSGAHDARDADTTVKKIKNTVLNGVLDHAS